MDLESTIETVASAVLETVTATVVETAQNMISGASQFIPDEISRGIQHVYTYFPKDFNLEDTVMFMLYFTAASLILGVLSRIVLGKRSSLNHSLSSAMGIAAIYALTIVIYTFQPWQLKELLSPLPFVSFSGEYLVVYPISATNWDYLCQHILSLIVLSFLVNALDSIVPDGETVLGWYLLRFLTVVLSMVLNLVVNWAAHQYLPENLVHYAPAVLLGVLAVMLFSGIISLVIGLVIAVTNPFLGAMYTFFFSNVVGKQLSKAVFTSAVLCAVFYLLDYFGYTIICISGTALIACIPLLGLLLLLWYLIGHVL
ncbi:MAG: hypothetical protein J6V25_01770 [Oscillospiraceae bacterium]|nr:hypothetical protein [Oscillospiraceae bacterium]